ncbi:MAG TPA: H-NS histone family protein [Nevskiaceae bacterium]|nr:H-NS histone family protein [Nevskiaceae bacterium]
MSKITDAQIDDLSREDLDALQQRLLKRIVHVETDKMKALRAEYTKLMERIGETVAPYGMTARGFVNATDAQVFEYMMARAEGASRPNRTSSSARSGAVVLPRYRHPKDHKLVWTGRGNKPNWVKEYLAGGKGRALIDLKIK